MSRKPAPRKPEELIAKLDVKFETFKEEINQLIAEKNIEIERINEKDSEIRLKIEENHNKGNENYVSTCQSIYMPKYFSNHSCLESNIQHQLSNK